MKKIISIICAIAIMFTFTTVAYAKPNDHSYIYDYADVISDADEISLEGTLDTMNSAYGFPIVIITKNGSPDYSIDKYAESFYSDNIDLFEVYDNPAGFIFVDDFDSNKYALYTVGDGDLVISDSDKSEIYNKLEPNYNTNDYYGSYLYLVGDIAGYLAEFKSGGDSAGESTTAKKYDENYDYTAPDSKGAYVVDSAELLKEDEEAALLKKIEALKSKYKIDIVIHTTNSIGEKSIQDYADDFYDYNGYGVGENKDGLLFMLNMNNGEEGNRDYYTSTTGSAITALTDYAIKDSDSRINSDVLPYLADGNYYKAFDVYLDLIDIFFAQAATGTPYDSSNPYKTTNEKIESILILEAIVIGISLFAAYMLMKHLKKKMEIAEQKAQAYDYLKPGSTVITNSSESFSHNQINKVERVKESSSSSSGSSTHTSSSGTSHGGGGGKF